MSILQIWATCSGFLVFLLMIKTIRFTRAIESLKDVKIGDQNGNKESSHELKLDWPKISFIVPACNEALTIETAALSLLNIDYPNLEIVIVNDRSNDDTGVIVDRLAFMDSRLKVMHIHELREGWLGKVHALERGISMTESEWILLADADIHFSADAIKKAIIYCQQKQLDFLTAVPDIKSKSFALQTLIAQLIHQASLFFDPKRLNDSNHKTCYGQGAFMLFKRSVYNRSEGMSWLRMEVIDDTGLAMMIRRAGGKMGAVAGQEEIQLEWYPDVASYIKGVEKNAFAFCQYNWTILSGVCAANWLLVFGFSLAPFFCGSTEVQLFCGAALLGYFTSVYFQMKKLMALNFWQVCLFPLAIAILPLVFIRAASLVVLNRGVFWRGTFYSLEALKENQRMKLGNLIFSVEEKPKEKASLEAPVLQTQSNLWASIDFILFDT